MRWQRPWQQGGSLTHHPSLAAVELKVDSPSWRQEEVHGASDEPDISWNTGMGRIGHIVVDGTIFLLETDTLLKNKPCTNVVRARRFFCSLNKALF